MNRLFMAAALAAALLLPAPAQAYCPWDGAEAVAKGSWQVAGKTCRNASRAFPIAGKLIGGAVALAIGFTGSAIATPVFAAKFTLHAEHGRDDHGG